MREDHSKLVLEKKFTDMKRPMFVKTCLIKLFKLTLVSFCCCERIRIELPKRLKVLQTYLGSDINSRANQVERKQRTSVCVPSQHKRTLSIVDLFRTRQFHFR